MIAQSGHHVCDPTGTSCVRSRSVTAREVGRGCLVELLHSNQPLQRKKTRHSSNSHCTLQRARWRRKRALQCNTPPKQTAASYMPVNKNPTLIWWLMAGDANPLCCI